MFLKFVSAYPNLGSFLKLDKVYTLTFQQSWDDMGKVLTAIVKFSPADSTFNVFPLMAKFWITCFQLGAAL
jgi:hypothetical protein